MLKGRKLAFTRCSGLSGQGVAREGMTIKLWSLSYLVELGRTDKVYDFGTHSLEVKLWQ